MTASKIIQLHGTCDSAVSRKIEKIDRTNVTWMSQPPKVVDTTEVMRRIQKLQKIKIYINKNYCQSKLSKIISRTRKVGSKMSSIGSTLMYG